jgi:transposase
MGTTDPAAIEAISSRKVSPTIQRYRRTVEFKRQIVEESFAPGASVARVARLKGVNANQVLNWPRLYREGLLKVANGGGSSLLAVRVSGAPNSAEAAREAKPLRDTAAGRISSGTIQTELPKGRLRPTGAVDREMLRMALEVLGDDRASGRDKDLDRGRGDGPEARLCGLERDGADGAGGESILRSCLRVPGATGRLDQSLVVGRRRAVPASEATGARRFVCHRRSERRCRSGGRNFRCC